MFDVNRKPVMRVVPGPDPQQYGIISRPTKATTETIVDRNKRFEESREKIARQERELKSELIKINFFDDSQRKSKLKQVKRTVDEIMNQRNFHLTERRNRLKALLVAEEEKYETEFVSLAETPLERAAKLREKAKRIKDEREREKKEFVDEKMEQKWRLECDELRNLQSKYLQSEMRDEHLRQMEERVEREKQRLDEEAMFAELWKNDIIAKQQREDNEARIAYDRNQQTVKILREQIKVLEDQKAEQKRLIMENARLSQERLNIDKLEKSLAHHEKLRQQAARKNELDQSVRLKMAIEARKAQEEMALDLKLLEDALASTQNEDEERAKKKQILLEEGKRYREYLKTQLEEEKRREKEIEKIVDAEVEKQFQKRLQQWRAEKEARKRLLQDVLKERREQVEYKLRLNEEKQKQLELEKIEVNEKIQYYMKLDEEEREKIHLKNKTYQKDLIGQIGYNQHLKARKKWSDYNEYQSCVKAEEDYQRKLITNIQNMKLDSLHPIRAWAQQNELK